MLIFNQRFFQIQGNKIGKRTCFFSVLIILVCTFCLFIFVVFAYPPPSSVAQSLLNNISIGAVEEEIGLLYYDLDDENPLYAIEVPDSMITKKGQVKENPFILLEAVHPLQHKLIF